MTDVVAGAATRVEWRVATVLSVLEETQSVRTLLLDVPGWPGHLAGHHVDVRLTADDGYQAQRSYSIASPPEDTTLALTVERLEDGEVSSYLCDELREGDRFELRGPIGGYFVWSVGDGGPLMLIGGGSGIVPLMAMLRHRAIALPRHAPVPTRLLYSSRRWGEMIYRKELERLSERDASLEITHTITREPSAGWSGYRRRIDRAMLTDVAWQPLEQPRIFLCGSTPLVEAVATELVALGHRADSIRTERFGPTGDAR